MRIRPIEEIVVSALKKELTRLSGAADRAKLALDERTNAVAEVIAINKEFVEIFNSRKTDQETLDKLLALQERQAKVGKVIKKSFSKLSDKQITLEIERDSLISEISTMEYRQGIR